MHGHFLVAMLQCVGGNLDFYMTLLSGFVNYKNQMGGRLLCVYSITSDSVQFCCYNSYYYSMTFKSFISFIYSVTVGGSIVLSIQIQPLSNAEFATGEIDISFTTERVCIS